MVTKKSDTRIRYRSLCVALLGALTLGSCIDEDLSKCGIDMELAYNMQLELGLEAELETELTTEAEQALGSIILDDLKHVFTTQAHGLNLYFFDADTHQPYRSEQHEINAGQATFTLYVEARKYEHAAIAFTDGTNELVDAAVREIAPDAMGNLWYDHTDVFSSLTVMQPQEDTVSSHRVGIFSGTQLIDADVQKSRTFHQQLHMRNSAVVIVLEPPTTMQPSQVQAYVKDMASSYNVADSTYSYSASPVVRTKATRAVGLYGFHTVCFPSRAQATAASTGEVWKAEVYVTRPDGKITQNVLSVSTPLKAGHIKIIKAHIKDDGSVDTGLSDVGVSVKLDWKPGGNHDVEI